ncbi:MAG: Stp1/IreP family PP2C-type Ser/Thr phosphatase [Clostridia bacterium]|nr:Stp1/IreP family PP2C-type Ser/Thr phosphatase [Clostridia bacterium]
MYFCGKSDVGMRRQVNQDSVRAVSIWGGEAVLLIVCDGMGGHQAGEIASRTAVDVFCDKVAMSPCYEETPQKILDFIRYTLVCAASEANAAVYTLAGENAEFLGMGTTLVAVLVYKGYFYAINVGDSRFYIVTRYEARQVTRDHSFVQYLIDNGKLTPEEARSYPRKNVITRAIGVSEKLDVDFFSAPLEPWESGYLLLCSDGLSNYTDNKVLVDILYDAHTVDLLPENELMRKAEKLIAYANNKGGSDNVSAVLAKF